MNVSIVDQSLILATYFRGNTPDQDRWTSCSDQIVTLSLFYTGDISADECKARFSCYGYVDDLYSENGELHRLVHLRYQQLVALVREQPHLIQGGGDFETPANPTYTACKLTDAAIRLVPDIIDLFPHKPDFTNWPDRRTIPAAT